ncbi:endonuclease/exonuclease/phosphatase family protein [Sphingobacterium sp. SYP-B4668]|uniref:endonuclease/exonuclease/phosphatase family protein n=1 Tax=Sphingobacterium sp. SYP-B4668 TaxID=2996035 RepID=UPI0022DDAB9F|nr:endonuclease/exonuclease/phosphatase family protein [Sphingobacterium sp. SYP-B4668]
MRRTWIVALMLLVFMTIAEAQQFRIATYNIRQKNTHDVGNMWDERREAVTNLIKYHQFEIFGTQEGFKDQLVDMENRLPGYKYIGVGRDDGAEKGEYSAIFYNTARFEVSKSGTFWLSATDISSPNKGWDAALPRICTWGIFKDKKTKKQFIMMNTHFDHVGVVARKESAKLMMAKAKEFAGNLPLVITGDFNVSETDEAYFTLANSKVVADCYTKIDFKYAPSSTFNGFGKNVAASGRIDHIFVTPQFKVKKYGILTDTYAGKYPSDHFPVVVDLVL